MVSRLAWLQERSIERSPPDTLEAMPEALLMHLQGGSSSSRIIIIIIIMLPVEP
jgi:hypothetical protein